MTSPKAGEITIKEAYRDYIPPIDASAVVRKLLNSVPKPYLGYLRGLSCIVLTNESALLRKDRFEKSRILGRYHRRTRIGGSAHVELRVDNIIECLKGVLLWLPIVREYVFGQVLFHELGHHIHLELGHEFEIIRPVYTKKEKEDVANKWAVRLNGYFFRKTYSHAMPLIVPMLKVYRFMRRKQVDS